MSSPLTPGSNSSSGSSSSSGHSQQQQYLQHQHQISVNSPHHPHHSPHLSSPYYDHNGPGSVPGAQYGGSRSGSATPTRTSAAANSPYHAISYNHSPNHNQQSPSVAPSSAGPHYSPSGVGGIEIKQRISLINSFKNSTGSSGHSAEMNWNESGYGGDAGGFNGGGGGSTPGGHSTPGHSTPGHATPGHMTPGQPLSVDGVYGNAEVEELMMVSEVQSPSRNVITTPNHHRASQSPFGGNSGSAIFVPEGVVIPPRSHSASFGYLPPGTPIHAGGGSSSSSSGGGDQPLPPMSAPLSSHSVISPNHPGAAGHQHYSAANSPYGQQQHSIHSNTSSHSSSSSSMTPPSVKNGNSSGGVALQRPNQPSTPGSYPKYHSCESVASSASPVTSPLSAGSTSNHPTTTTAGLQVQQQQPGGLQPPTRCHSNSSAAGAPLNNSGSSPNTPYTPLNAPMTPGGGPMTPGPMTPGNGVIGNPRTPGESLKRDESSTSTCGSPFPSNTSDYNALFGGNGAKRPFPQGSASPASSSVKRSPSSMEPMSPYSSRLAAMGLAPSPSLLQGRNSASSPAAGGPPGTPYGAGSSAMAATFGTPSSSSHPGSGGLGPPGTPVPPGYPHSNSSNISNPYMTPNPYSHQPASAASSVGYHGPPSFGPFSTATTDSSYSEEGIGGGGVNPNAGGNLGELAFESANDLNMMFEDADEDESMLGGGGVMGGMGRSGSGSGSFLSRRLSTAGMYAAAAAAGDSSVALNPMALLQNHIRLFEEKSRLECAAAEREARLARQKMMMTSEQQVKQQQQQQAAAMAAALQGALGGGGGERGPFGPNSSGSSYSTSSSGYEPIYADELLMQKSMGGPLSSPPPPSSLHHHHPGHHPSSLHSGGSGGGHPLHPGHPHHPLHHPSPHHPVSHSGSTGHHPLSSPLHQNSSLSATSSPFSPMSPGGMMEKAYSSASRHSAMMAPYTPGSAGGGGGNGRSSTPSHYNSYEQLYGPHGTPMSVGQQSSTFSSSASNSPSTMTSGGGPVNGSSGLFGRSSSSGSGGGGGLSHHHQQQQQHHNSSSTPSHHSAGYSSMPSPSSLPTFHSSFKAMASSSNNSQLRSALRADFNDLLLSKQQLAQQQQAQQAQQQAHSHSQTHTQQQQQTHSLSGGSRSPYNGSGGAESPLYDRDRHPLSNHLHHHQQQLPPHHHPPPLHAHHPHSQNPFEIHPRHRHHHHHQQQSSELSSHHHQQQQQQQQQNHHQYQQEQERERERERQFQQKQFHPQQAAALHHSGMALPPSVTKTVNPIESITFDPKTGMMKVRKKRGRPRKNPLPPTSPFLIGDPRGGGSGGDPRAGGMMKSPVGGNPFSSPSSSSSSSMNYHNPHHHSNSMLAAAAVAAHQQQNNNNSSATSSAPTTSSAAAGSMTPKRDDFEEGASFKSLSSGKIRFTLSLHHDSKCQNIHLLVQNLQFGSLTGSWWLLLLASASTFIQLFLLFWFLFLA